jgi:hypothetical protein
MSALPHATDIAGFMTNPSVVSHFLVGEDPDYSAELLNDSQVNQLIILKKERKAPQCQRIADSPVDIRRLKAVTVIGFNFYQHMMQMMPGPDDEIPSAEEVWSKYYVHGIVASEEGQDGESPGPSQRDRLLNVKCDGWVAQTPNGWGNKVKADTRLFLILKQVESNGKYGITADGATKTVPDIGTIRTNKPFQLSFYADYRYEYPPESELMYTDEHGATRRGLAIYIGRAFEGSMATNASMMNESNVNIASLMLQPPIPVVLELGSVGWF